MRVWRFMGRTIRRPGVMGIVNVTPDSFSDGGLAFDPSIALARGKQLAAEGADVIDVGGESTRPGADGVTVDEELRRVLPVIEALASRIETPISIDTTKAEVARRALAAGASAVNDVSGATADPAMLEVVAESDAGLVLMHALGRPRTMQDDPHYEDVVSEVHRFLAGAVERAERLGIARERIMIDPGVGFGKTIEHNLTLLRALPSFGGLGCAILVGTSRKRFLGMLTGREVGDRGAASLASALAALEDGADVVRVHDVASTVDAIKVWTAQKGWDER